MYQLLTVVFYRLVASLLLNVMDLIVVVLYHSFVETLKKTGESHFVKEHVCAICSYENDFLSDEILSLFYFYSKILLGPIRFQQDQIINEPRHEKTNVLVSDQVRHKPGCTATEDG